MKSRLLPYEALASLRRLSLRYALYLFMFISVFHTRRFYWRTEKVR
jgi:hypothetical protein